jgi:hypothetical protein
MNGQNLEENMETDTVAVQPQFALGLGHHRDGRVRPRQLIWENGIYD